MVEFRAGKMERVVQFRRNGCKGSDDAVRAHDGGREQENRWQLSTNDGDPEDTQVTIENARRWTMEMGWGADRSLLSPASMSSQRGGGGGVGEGTAQILLPPLSPPMPGRVMGGRNGYTTSNNNTNNMNTNANRDMDNNNENAMLSASTSQIFQQQQQQQRDGRGTNGGGGGGSGGLNNIQENKQQLQMYGGGGGLVVAGVDGDTCPWYMQTKEAHESISTAREDGNWTSLGTSTLGSALTPRSSRSHARHGHAACAIGNKMIVIGGNTAGTVRSDIIALDCKTLQWEQVEVFASSPARALRLGMGTPCVCYRRIWGEPNRGTRLWRLHEKYADESC